MINVVCGIRSTGRICTDLADELSKEGHIVKIAYGRESVPNEYKKYAVRIGSELDVMMHGIKARLSDSCGFGSYTATKKFIEWVKVFNPDAIHLHNLHGYYINIELLFDYLRSYEKKIIWTLHDCWAFTGHSVYCDTRNCTKWKEGCNCCPLKKSYPASLVDKSKKNWIRKKQAFSNISNLTIVTPSNWLADMFKESFISNYPLEIIRNGIDTSIFRPIRSDFKDKYGLNDKYVLLGVATAWDEMKGMTDYFKLANLLGEQYQIVLVGLTQKQKKHIPQNILGIERTNNVDELVEIYSGADLFLNLSYCENYPTVNLEALACGIPVLTYNSGGSAESAIGGIVVERGNIVRVAEEVENYKKNIKNTRVDVDKFKISHAYTLELYKRLLMN